MATRKKPRTAAQKRATAKLVASNRRRRAAGGATAAAPRRRRRTSVRTHATRTYRRAHRAAGSAVRRYRRHHARQHKAGFGIVHLLTQAGTGAVGAIAIDFVYNKLPIPATMKLGNTGALVKAGVTIGAGVLAAKFLPRNLAHGATVGALTVQLHNMLKGFMGGAGVAGYTDINGYVSDASGMGFYSPAAIADQSGMGAYMSGVGEDDLSTSPYDYVY